MQRRAFLRGTALTAGGAALAAPALAQERIEWDMVTSWPTGAPGVDDSARRIAKTINELSGGRLVITVHGAGEIVPAFGVFDAVSQGTAQIYHSVPSYWTSKSKAFGLFGSFPFGFTAPEHMGWMYHGGGQDLYDRTYDQFDMKGFIAGNSGPQWFGWFKEEIATVDDLRGLPEEMEPALRNFLQEMGPAFAEILGEIKDLSAYHPPEVLPNGDIILRKKTPEEIAEEPPADEIEI